MKTNLQELEIEKWSFTGMHSNAYSIIIVISHQEAKKNKCIGTGGLGVLLEDWDKFAIAAHVPASQLNNHKIRNWQGQR